MQDGGINVRCEHRCKMAVRTPMQTAMDRNGNGWHKMKILCCVLLFLFCCFCFRCLWCSHPAVVFAHWHKLTQINSEEHPPNVSLGFSCYQERVWKSSSIAWRYEKTTKQRTAMVTCKVRTPMQDGGINARCEHRCKMAVRTPMQTAMDRNGNGWHKMKILCCVLLFLFCCFCFRCLWCSHPAVVFAHWHKLTQINSNVTQT